MTSETDIGNLALGRVKQGSIASFAEVSAEANAVNRLYAISRNHVLADFPWRVNTYIQSLTETTNDRTDDWTYKYLRPTCIRFWDLLPRYGRKRQRIRTRYELNAAGIYTDEQYARGVIGTLVTDTTLYSPALVSCIAWRLASELVMPLEASLNLQAYALRMYEKEKMEAWATDALEELVVDDAAEGLPTTLAARLG